MWDPLLLDTLKDNCTDLLSLLDLRPTPDRWKRVDPVVEGSWWMVPMFRTSVTGFAVGTAITPGQPLRSGPMGVVFGPDAVAWSQSSRNALPVLIARRVLIEGADAWSGFAAAWPDVRESSKSLVEAAGGCPSQLEAVDSLLSSRPPTCAEFDSHGDTPAYESAMASVLTALSRDEVEGQVRAYLDTLIRGVEPSALPTSTGCWSGLAASARFYDARLHQRPWLVESARAMLAVGSPLDRFARVPTHLRRPSGGDMSLLIAAAKTLESQPIEPALARIVNAMVADDYVGEAHLALASKQRHDGNYARGWQAAVAAATIASTAEEPEASEAAYEVAVGIAADAGWTDVHSYLKTLR